MIKEKQEKSKCMLFPTSKFILYWDLIVLILLLYTVLWVPYKVSFENEEETDFQFKVDLIVDTLFLTDVVINFLKAYIDNKSKIYVVNRCKIAK